MGQQYHVSFCGALLKDDHSPLGIFNVLKSHNGILRSAICSRHRSEGVDAFSLCLANTKKDHIHLQRLKSVRLAGMPAKFNLMNKRTAQIRTTICIK